METMMPMQNPRLYDFVMGPFERLVLGRWRRDVFGTARGAVLEIGGGTGCTLPHYREARSVVLSDASPAMLERSRARAARVSFPVAAVVADGMALPFASGAFDTVVVSLALCTVPDPARAFAEIGRVLKPDGELRMLEHVRVRRPWVAHLQDVLTPGWKRRSGGCHLNRATFETALECGFVAERSWTGLGGWLVAAHMKPGAGVKSIW